MSLEIYLADASIIRSVAGELISAGAGKSVVKRGNEHDSRFTLQASKGDATATRSSEGLSSNRTGPLCRGQDMSFMLHLVFKAVPNFPAVTDLNATSKQRFLVLGHPVLPVAPFSVQQLNIK
jgi:hypothetical protein